MPKCQLILSEKNGEWAAALRVVAPPANVQVVQTRSLSATLRALEMAPASLVAVHASDDIAAAIDFLLEAPRRFPLARFAALLKPDDKSVEVPLREAGAIEVIHSVLDLPRLSRLADRHFALTPQDETSLTDWVQSRMPWKQLAIASA